MQVGRGEQSFGSICGLHNRQQNNWSRTLTGVEVIREGFQAQRCLWSRVRLC